MEQNPETGAIALLVEQDGHRGTDTGRVGSASSEKVGEGPGE